jgi:hypothetical protein
MEMVCQSDRLGGGKNRQAFYRRGKAGEEVSTFEVFYKKKNLKN